MFQWVKGNTKTSIVTIYPTNFTLNNVASSYFSDIRWCLIGLDDEEKKVAIKPVTKREIDLNLVDVENLHKVSLGKGYARISNKAIIDHISQSIQKTCDGIKFESSYDNENKMLIINLDKPLSMEV